MQAVRGDAEPLSAEKQAELLRTLDTFAKPNASLAYPKALEALLLEPGIPEFLCQQWDKEERKRQQRERFLGSFLSGKTTIVGFIVIMIFTLTTMVLLYRYFHPLFYGGILLFIWMIGRRRQQLAVMHLLICGSHTPPLTMLVDALLLTRVEPIAPLQRRYRDDVCERLIYVLPYVHDRDLPALDAYRKNALFAELESQLTNSFLQPLKKFPRSTNFALLTAILQYFTQEMVLKQEIPKGLVPLLTQILRQKTETVKAGQETFYRASEVLLYEVTLSRNQPVR